MEIADEILEVHGVAPESKAEGVTRVIHENRDGLKIELEGIGNWKSRRIY